MLPFDIESVQTPCYVVDKHLLEANLRLLRQVATAAGCKILLAQKAFSMYHFYPLVGQYLQGSTASGLFEARLAHQHLPGEVHVFSPAFKAREMEELCRICGHMVFNSFSQWEAFGEMALAAGVSCGLRINPECSTQQSHAIYDPCAPGARLGVPLAAFRPQRLAGLEGFHFHTLCEQDADALQTTLEAVEGRFGPWLPGMKWLNMGGGHHITKPGYNIELLVRLVRQVKERYGLEVYLEPGEAVALNAGFLVGQVADLVENDGVVNAILDVSAACHMPDVIEMPYRPPLHGSGQAGERPHTYRLAGPTCLAGDIIGNYSFNTPLKPGSRLVFEDMAIYTMVKNNTFNGVGLPRIYASENGQARLVKQFGYEDFKARLS